MCGDAFEQGGERAFYAAFYRDSSGEPEFGEVSQLETKGPNKSRVTQRPVDCTCTNTLLHSKGRKAYKGKPAAPACELYVPCDCGSRDPRRHSFECAQRIVWQTRDGVWAGMVHVDCAIQFDCVIPAGTVRARYGRRTVGNENKPGEAPVAGAVVFTPVDTAPVAPAPVAPPAPVAAPVAPVAPPVAVNGADVLSAMLGDLG
jgi:hypothetical protein